MKKDEKITEVIFRKYKPKHAFGNKGVIIALFPYELFNYHGNVTCYEKVGQHGEADYGHVVGTLTTSATESEYAKLKSELEGLGYNLKVAKRRNYDKFLKAKDLIL